MILPPLENHIVDDNQHTDGKRTSEQGIQIRQITQSRQIIGNGEIVCDKQSKLAAAASARLRNRP